MRRQRRYQFETERKRKGGEPKLPTPQGASRYDQNVRTVPNTKNHALLLLAAAAAGVSAPL